jgi:RNA polymerase sigma-70 factor (ECF subfamily)
MSERTEYVTEAIFAAYGKSWDSLGSVESNLTDLNEEALYLAKLLADLLPNEPEAKGLLAFILFCESRKSARRSNLGEYIPLEEQDVKIWHQTYIAQAEKSLAEAFSKGKLGRFQLEAAIQSAHCARVKFKINNWSAILKLYDGLLSIAPTTGAIIGRINALSEVQGPDVGIEALNSLPAEITQNYQPFWALKASLLSSLRKSSEAEIAYNIAIGLSQDEAVKNFLRKKMLFLGNLG